MTDYSMTWKKRNIVIAMIIIAMFLSGMHFEKFNIASLFCNVSGSLQTYQTASCDAKMTTNDSCTLDQLSNITIRGAVEFIRRSVADNLSKVRSRNAECIFDLFMTAHQKLMQRTRDTQYILESIIPSINVIITYIHQQDGKKAALS